MHKKFIIQSLLLVAVIFGGLYIFKSTLSQNLAINSQTYVMINDTKIKIELADDSTKRAKGLGGRSSLASDSGMLFSFPKTGNYSFWMKGMKFPIDIIWINGLKVVDLIRGATPPPPGAPDQEIPIYLSNQPFDKVLEVNSGFAESHGIKVGDQIQIVGPDSIGGRSR